MAHAQKPDFVSRRNGRVHLNRQGLQFSQLLAAEVCVSAVVMLDTPCSEVVKSTGYPFHSPVSPSLPLLCVTVCHHVSAGLYLSFHFPCYLISSKHQFRTKCVAISKCSSRPHSVSAFLSQRYVGSLL